LGKIDCQFEIDLEKKKELANFYCKGQKKNYLVEKPLFQKTVLPRAKTHFTTGGV